MIIKNKNKINIKLIKKNILSILIFIVALNFIIFFDTEKFFQNIISYIDNIYFYDSKNVMTDNKNIDVLDKNRTINNDENIIDTTNELKYSTVTEDYFNRTLFIGDSRMEGFKNYIMLPGAIYYTNTSYGVFNGFDKKFSITNIGSMTLNQLLDKIDFEKIYICLGINNVATDTENHKQKFVEYINHIREKEPNAIIYLLSNLHITRNAKTNDSLNNENINLINNFLMEISDNVNIFYLDPNYLYDDENGDLNEDYSIDGYHIYVSMYDKYLYFLLTHAIVK